MKELKLSLKKKQLKNLTLDSRVIPTNITAKVVGGNVELPGTGNLTSRPPTRINQ